MGSLETLLSSSLYLPYENFSYSKAIRAVEISGKAQEDKGYLPFLAGYLTVSVQVSDVNSKHVQPVTFGSHTS